MGYLNRLIDNVKFNFVSNDEQDYWDTYNQYTQLSYNKLNTLATIMLLRFENTIQQQNHKSFLIKDYRQHIRTTFAPETKNIVALTKVLATANQAAIEVLTEQVKLKLEINIPQDYMDIQIAREYRSKRRSINGAPVTTSIVDYIYSDERGAIQDGYERLSDFIDEVGIYINFHLKSNITIPQSNDAYQLASELENVCFNIVKFLEKENQ